MKKKFVTGLLMCEMVGTMLTGCSDNKEVTKVDESTAVIAETTETTESVEKTTETEAVAEDFLSKNDITITPQGSMTMLLTPSQSPDTDDVEEMGAVVSVVTTESDEEGYSDTTATFEVTINTALSYWVTAFDRYTGTSLESNPQSFETNETAVHHDNVCVIDIDGTQYDCGLTVSQEVNGSVVKVTMTAHHPSAYDGVVFQFGKYGVAQNTEAQGVNYSTAFTVDQYPALLDGQYFFTATDK